MTEKAPIDVETVPADRPTQTQALAVRDPGGAVSTNRLSVEELKANLSYIREVMQNVMAEGQDYGKIPGCGDKPSLLQPGAQKLCMTFQLQDRVRKEEVRDLPGGHREYAFTICLVSATGREWDGVGTCSTLEGKYRYRKANRRCPQCGTNNIIQGKAEWGGGWICFKKKGGCGAKFPENDQRITSQPAGDVEHENPADYWNTVRKMAFKRALVHAAINATNTSELWTQDVEDMPEVIQGARPPAGKPQQAPGATSAPSPPATTPPRANAPAAPQSAPPALKPATEATRDWMLKGLDDIRDQAREYFTKLTDPTPLAPFEDLKDLKLRFVPNTPAKLKALRQKILDFANGNHAAHAYEYGEMEVLPAAKAKPTERGLKTAAQALPEGLKPQASAAPAAPTPAAQAPAGPAAPKPPKDDEWWREVMVPVPHKGQRRAEYLENPDTIGSLYNARHESEDARKRLFGFVSNYEPKGWTRQDGTPMPPGQDDLKFREALDAFADWFERNHPDEKR